MGYKISNNRIKPIEPRCGKTIYYSAREADDMVKYIKENRHVKDIHSYKCTICGFWHLTSKSG